MQETPRAGRRRLRRIHRYLKGLDKAAEGSHLDLARWMRVHKTPGEKEIWRVLKRLNRIATEVYGRGTPRPRWRCQTPKYGFIADFYCPFYKLVLEVDGSDHRTTEGKARGARKDAAFAKHGIEVIRLPWPFVRPARQLVAEAVRRRRASVAVASLPLLPQNHERNTESPA